MCCSGVVGVFRVAVFCVCLLSVCDIKLSNQLHPQSWSHSLWCRHCWWIAFLDSSLWGRAAAQEKLLPPVWRERSQRSKLSGVKSLRMTCSPNAGDCQAIANQVYYLSSVFPNVVSVDLSGLNANDPDLVCVYFVRNHCPQISRFIWNGCNDRSGLPLCRMVFGNARNLTDISLDHCHFEVFDDDDVIEFSDLTGRRSHLYLLWHCRRVEHLSIRNATYSSLSHPEHDDEPVSQDMLIKMVRNDRTLCWLRSDLSDENVTMLRQERPHITFARLIQTLVSRLASNQAFLITTFSFVMDSSCRMLETDA